MSVTRITHRFTRTVLAQYRSSPLLFGRNGHRHLHSSSEQLISTRKVVPRQLSFSHLSTLNASMLQRFGFSSSASPQSNEKEMAQSGNEQEIKSDNDEEYISKDLEIDLSKDDLLKLVAEKKQLLELKQEELQKMQDKVLRTYAETENVKERTRRESENVKKFAIQNFAKSLLDVADNLGRASSAAKESFLKVDASKGTSGAAQQLKILLEGVEMTEKQLSEIFKKFGLEKYDPINEGFDPNMHNAVFQVPDASKPVNQVAVVLKSGYMLHDRVIRPAEVGVTVAIEQGGS